MDTNLVKLIEQFRSEERCRAYLEKLRWPDGIKCPRCASSKISRVIKRHQFDCDSCRYQFSVTAGTLFGDTHLPLWKWFLAIYMMCESKKSISACQLQRTLGVSYKTAWFLCHRIRKAMLNGNDRLKGTVEIDETYVGGRSHGTRGRGAKNKTAVIGMVERSGELRMQPLPDLTRETILRIVQEHVSPEVLAIYTDELSSYGRLRKAYKGKHRRIRHKKEWVHGNIHTNTIEGAWSLQKRAIVGSYHKISMKHLPAYLEEIAFRFNNRKNPRLFQLTLKRLLGSAPLQFDKLVA